MTTATDDAETAIAVEVKDAWNEYLAATRHKDGDDYETVEAWAGSRLDARLVAVEKRRKKVASAR